MRVLHVGLEWGWWGKLSPGCLDDPSRGQVAGGETAMLRAAESMAGRGWEIVVASDIFPGRYKGTRYVEGQTRFLEEALENGPWDAIVIWGNPDEFANLTAAGVCERTLRVCAQQVNSFFRPDAAQGFVDLYVSPSWNHARLIHRRYGIPMEQLLAIPNAVHPPRFRWDRPREPEAVYTASSPDRGQHLLLEAWPEIRHLEPLATLDVYYETERWIASCRVGETYPAIWTRMWQVSRAQDARHYAQGVRFHGAVNQQAVVDRACTAGVMAYPCYPLAYTEGFATSILEAYCAGAVPVVTDADALPEIYLDKSIMVPLPELRGFASKVVEAIRIARERKDAGWLGWHFKDEAAARAEIAKCSWDQVGETWIRVIEGGVAEKRKVRVAA